MHRMIQTARGIGVLCIVLAGTALVPAASAKVVRVAVDTEQTTVDFEVRTRLGQRLKGHFPAFHGYVEKRDDGQERFVMVLEAAQAEIQGSPRYTRWLRGEEFFDAAHHPLIVFESDPIPAGIGRTGGLIEGQLHLRGIAGPLRLQVESAGCERPGYDCAVNGKGEVSRANHGMDRWQFAVSDRVMFLLKVRQKSADPT